MPEKNDRKQKRDHYFELGVVKLDEGNIEEAIKAFLNALRYDPRYSACYSNLGIAYELASDYQKARDSYRRALELNPRSLAALNSLADMSMRNGSAEEAIAMYKESIATDALYVEPYLNIARFLMESKEFINAESYLRKVLAVEPDNTEALNMLGVITNLTNRSEEAVGHFQEALKQNVNESSVLSNLGTALRNTGDLKRAIIAFEKAYELNPQNVSILNNLGLLYRETGQRSRAESQFKKAIEKIPDSPFSYFNLAEFYLDSEDYTNALENLKHYITLVPLDMDTLFKTCGIARMGDLLGNVQEEMQSFIKEADDDDSRVDDVKLWIEMVEKV